MSELDPHTDYSFFDAEYESEYYEYSPSLEDLSSFASDEDQYDEYEDLEEAVSGLGYNYEDMFSDIDFSDFSGKYRPNMRRAIRKSREKNPTSSKRPKNRPRRKKPLSKNIPVRSRAKMTAPRGKSTEKILVPDSRKVIIEGVNSFLLDNSVGAMATKNIGYYKGKKLKELVLTFNNNSAVDFEMELFNPSMPLDYLQSTSLNINDQVQVAGGNFVSYTDILYNMLANPARLYNAKFTLAGPSLLQQINQPLIISNKSISGKEKVVPFQMQLNIDIDQNQSDLIYFDLSETLNRPFIPDGMDIISYKVLAGMTVTFGFYYSQVSLKKFFYPEAKAAKGLF